MKSLNLKKLCDAGFCVPRFAAFDKTENINTDFSDAELFAVRSDFSAEDGMSQSFAGQFETKLNVKRSEVKNAAAEIIKSGEKTIKNGYSSSRGTLGIIVQEMVQPSLAGVIFTANPQGLLNEMVLVIGNGLGAGIVEDKVPTTTVYYCSNDKLYYTESQENAPDIDEGLINRLFNTALLVRDTFESEQDIEFAVCGDKIYLLQARPITTLDYTAPRLVLDNSNIVESYPGISLPATQDFVREVYTKVFQSCVRRVTKSEKLCKQLAPSLENMIDCVNGRIYYRISSWYDLICMLPFSKKIIPIWQEMLGVNEKSVITSPYANAGIFTKTKIAFGFLTAMLKAPAEMQRLCDYFKQQLPLYRKKLEACSNISQLLNFYDDLLLQLSARWDVTLINDLYAFIFTALAQKKYPDKISTVYKLESMRPVIALQQLCKTAAHLGTSSEEYKTAKNAYIHEFGDRALEELKLETRTMRTEPQLLDDYVNAQKDSFINEFETETAESHHQPWVLKKARCGIQNRERSRLDRCRIFGVARQILLKIGDILASEGKIDNAQDVFWLKLCEIRSQQNNASFKSIIIERKALYDSYSKIPAYSRMVFLKEVFNKAPQNIGLHRAFETHDLLCGVPCSGGIADGEILLVENAELSLDTKGKILVTQTTDPGWVFLIKNAAGLISEKGSLLSHTSIIARELKKPAVAAVKNAMHRFKNGQRVRIDGTSGIITIIDNEES